MSRTQLTCLAVLLSLTGICAWAAESPEDLAQKAAEFWLKLVDDGKYDDSWTQAATRFKGGISKEQWQRLASGVKNPLGKLVSRKLTSRKYVEKLPGKPDGKYVEINYDTVFESKASAVETVRCMLDPDGTWRVTGYIIK